VLITNIVGVLVIGVDVGGSGARAAIAGEQGVVARSELNGITDKVEAVVRIVHDLLARAEVYEVDAVAVGAAGFQLTGAKLRDGVPQKMPSRRVLLCSDMLTSYIGALGLRDGAVIAAGTGAVALGSDMAGTWQRVDGWGYLLGDHGSGSWIGRHAMHAALRAADGRPGGSELLLKSLDKDPAELVAEINERPDRAGLMASFVPAVARAAEQGDGIALGLLRTAGDHLADTALAALPLGARRTIATTGNLFKLGGPLWQRFTARLKHVELKEANGTGLDGALTLSKAVITNELPENAPSLTLVKN
jgi:N-acetylglucosamine kinase-like BadF-type ATPase